MMGEFGPKIEASRINLAEAADFDLGGLCVSPARREVSMNGQRRELEPRVTQVLVALAWARPDVVSRDRLIEQCWDGRIVGDDALNRCIVALRHLAKEFSPQPFEIETVSRVGYSLVERPEVAAARGADKAKAKVIAALFALLLVASMLTYGWFQFWRPEAAPASIAVLPFRNLSTGDPYFAEGVSEEIMSQLAREPEFRVAGSASSAQFRGASDPGKVGRALGVNYILEGSVRPGKGRVRINASLIQTSDGKRLWSETYDRRPDDILEIQTAIGQAVASGLKRRLVHSLPVARRAVNGEAYALYLNARGLIRSANPQSGHEAVQLLEEAIRRDRNFAPAWAELAGALLLEGRTKGTDGLTDVVPRARSAANRALQLDPNLAQAHGVLASVLGTETPEAIVHLRRAAELDPRSGEGLMWRGVLHEVTGEYTEAVATYYRAHRADPVWPRPVRALVDVNAIMGDRPAVERIVASGITGDPMTQQFALARAAWFLGDLSEAARRWSIVTNNPSARFVGSAARNLNDARLTLGLSREPPLPAMATLGSLRFGPRVWLAAAPSPAEWQKRNRSFAATLVNFDENAVAAKLMLTAGRARELVSTYDGPNGVLSIRPGLPLGTCQLDEATTVALALRAVGRTREADALLAKSDALIQRVYRHGKVPNWFDEDAAGVWAAQGKSQPAVEALSRALRRGWVHVGRTDLPRLEDEPAFRLLRDDPRFKAVLAKYKAHYARERAETARILKIPA